MYLNVFEVVLLFDSQYCGPVAINIAFSGLLERFLLTIQF